MVGAAALGLERVVVSLVPMGIAASLLHAALRGVGLRPAAALAVSGVAACAGTIVLAGRLPAYLDGGLRRAPWLAVAWLGLGAAAVAATAWLSIFMIDASRAERSIYPFDDFFVHHSCLSAHYRSAQLQRAGVANVYERTNFEGPAGEPTFVDGFVVDVFLYPPPMLLASRLALALSEDFGAWRAVWFALEGALVGLALLAVAGFIGGAEGARAAWLAPLVWVAVPTLLTLQIGNLHLAAIALSMLAMIALARGRHAIGGTLLAAITLFKIFPGILIVLLLCQRRWRSLAWVTGAAGTILALAFAILGMAPFRAFVTYQLPRLASGAAFESLFAHPDTIAANQSIFGLVQKLDLLGAPGMGGTTAAAVTWIYTGALIAVVAVRARATLDRASQALLWLVLVQLASLRSPFTPDTYAAFPLVWMLVLWLARRGWAGWRTAGVSALLVLANALVPAVEIMPITWLLAATLAMQLVFFACYATEVWPARPVNP